MGVGVELSSDGRGRFPLEHFDIFSGIASGSVDLEGAGNGFSPPPERSAESSNVMMKKTPFRRR